MSDSNVSTAIDYLSQLQDQIVITSLIRLLNRRGETDRRVNALKLGRALLRADRHMNGALREQIKELSTKDSLALLLSAYIHAASNQEILLGLFHEQGETYMTSDHDEERESAMGEAERPLVQLAELMYQTEELDYELIRERMNEIYPNYLKAEGIVKGERAT